MSSKSIPAFLLGLVLIGLLSASGSAFAEKDIVAEQFDVKMVARPDGSLLVTETIVFRFQGGPFTSVSREIPTRETDGIIDFVASMDGVPYPMGPNTGQLERTGDDPVRLTWHFLPVSDSVHTFILNYRARGVIRVDEQYDLLQWNAVPFEHDYPILSSTVQITYPRRSRVAIEPEVNLKRAHISGSGTTYLIRARNLQQDAGLQVSVHFQRNSLITDPPTWQQHRVATTQTIYRVVPWALATFALLFLAGIGALYLFWEHTANVDRSEAAISVTGTHVTQPPGELPPGLAGLLLAPGNRPTWHHALSTLLDLAQRGVINIQEVEGKPRIHKRDFSFQLQTLPDDLREYEQKLLDLLFQSNYEHRKSVKVSEIKSQAQGRSGQFYKPLIEELRQAGLLSGQRQILKNRMATAGITLLIAGLGGIILSLVAAGVATNMEAWTGLTIALFILSISLSSLLLGFTIAIISGLFSALTQKGAQAAANWRAYSEYLREVSRERETAAGPGAFETGLSYAVSFGLGEVWAKMFRKHGEGQLPAWFQPLSAGGEPRGDAGMAALEAMISMTNSAGSAGSSLDGAAGGAPREAG